MKVPTKQLLNLIIKEKHRIVEASLNNGALNATHFFWFRRNNIWDSGIDGVTTPWKPNEFLALYPKAYWKVDQIV